jgi:hypothetical protein
MLTWVACQDTYNQARKKDATITNGGCKSWYDRNLVKKNNLPGYNSFIPDRPKQEYSIDLAFFNDLKTDEDRKFSTCMFCIDPFDKYAAAVPLKSKQPPDILAGLMEGFHKMDGKPESIYT